MDTNASTNRITIPSQRLRELVNWVPVYTGSVAFMGFLISLYAIFHMPRDWDGLVFLILAAAVVELASVELFQSSRSYVSMSSIIAIASIAAYGPMAGVITYLTSGLATALKTSLQSGNSYEKRASLFHRTSFNAGMWVIAGFAAGVAFVFAGGIPGNIMRATNIPALVLAAGVEWLVNASLLIGVIALQTNQRPLDIWNRDIRWQAPVSILGGVIGGAVLAQADYLFGSWGTAIVLMPILSTSYAFRLYKNNMKEYVDGLEKLNRELKDAMTDLEKYNLELTSANSAIRRLNSELFQSLAKVFDMRDPYVGGHAAQVAAYAVAIAVEMGLPADRIEIIRRSALLHDIGKLAIPEAILHKPGKLTEIEYQFVKKHTDIGADLLDSTEGLKHLAPFVRHHHERWDGRGYPLGLAGEEIPLEARILNVCDSVESMASDRPYHRGMSLRDITAELSRCAGSQFDPEIAEVFIKLLRQRGTSFVVNSARSVTQQYAASLIADESLAHNMFAWVLEKEAAKQTVSMEGNQ